MSAETFFRELLAKADIGVDGGRPWDLEVRDARLWDRMLRDGSLGFGEAFMDGWFDCERIDLLAERAYRARLTEQVDAKTAVFEAFKARINPFGAKGRSFEIGRVHYDIGNDLFELMLDPLMQYSCAYWQRATTLEDAQRDKLDLLCRKLQIEPGQTLLDIGCGWGGLALHAAREYGARVVGITVSKEQAALAAKRCEGHDVEIRLVDYRDLHDRFDRIVSVGMFEHVGKRHFAEFYETCHRCLAPDGFLVLHTVGYPKDEPINPWFDKYVMPGVEFPTVEDLGAAAAPTTLALEHFQALEGRHYDRTLMAWWARSEAAWPKLPAHYDERFRRMWKLYLQGCAAGFRTEQMRVWQLVYSAEGASEGYAFGHRAAFA